MTPSERAKELFDQMHHYQPASLKLKEASRMRAKESAIIAVNLLLTETTQHGLSRYWSNVLDHLKAL